MGNYTLNYTGEKVDELLNKIDTAFGETTTYSDTLTWDGDMTGRVYAETEMPVDDEGNTATAYLVKISDAVPTFEDLQSGGTATAFTGSESISLEFGDGLDLYYIDMGNVLLDEQMQMPVIAKEDNVDVMGMFTLPEKGVYVMAMPAMGVYVSSFTINNYTGFERVEVVKLPAKYVPAHESDIIITVRCNSTTAMESWQVSCNKTYAKLSTMSKEELLSARIELDYGDGITLKPVSVRVFPETLNDGGTIFQAGTVYFGASLITEIISRHLLFGVTSQGTAAVMPVSVM